MAEGKGEKDFVAVVVAEWGMIANNGNEVVAKEFFGGGSVDGRGDATGESNGVEGIWTVM